MSVSSRAVPAPQSQSGQRADAKTARPARTLPAVAVETDATAAHRNAFLLEPEPLRQHAVHVAAQADAAARIHHAMPGQIHRTLSHRVSDGARGARPAEDRGELSVRGHLAARDL